MLLKLLRQHPRAKRRCWGPRIYDVQGNLIEQVVDPDGTGLHDVTTKYAYDPNANVWADLSSTGTLLARRLFGSQQDSLIARIDSNGVGWYLTDMLGSVRDITNSSGSIIVHQDFNAWGQMTYQSGATYADRFGFTGRPLDSVTGLQNNRDRWYDAATSRWTTDDPTQFQAGDSNLYRYALNTPTDYTDPSGDVAIVGALLIAALVFFAGDIGSVNAPLQGDPTFSSDQNAIGDAIRFAPAGRGVVGLANGEIEAFKGAGFGLVLNVGQQAGGNADDWLNGRPYRGFSTSQLLESTASFGGLNSFRMPFPRTLTYGGMAYGTYRGVDQIVAGERFTGAVNLGGTAYVGWTSRSMIQRDLGRLRLSLPGAPQTQIRVQGIGGNGAASELRSLNGLSRTQATQALEQAGFRPTQPNPTPGGWQTFRHADGSQVDIGPGGRVVRTAAPQYGPDGSRINRGQRLASDGSEIPRSLPHDQHPPETLGQ